MGSTLMMGSWFVWLISGDFGWFLVLAEILFEDRKGLVLDSCRRSGLMALRVEPFHIAAKLNASLSEITVT